MTVSQLDVQNNVLRKTFWEFEILEDMKPRLLTRPDLNKTLYTKALMSFPRERHFKLVWQLVAEGIKWVPCVSFGRQLLEACVWYLLKFPHSPFSFADNFVPFCITQYILAMGLTLYCMLLILGANPWGWRWIPNTSLHHGQWISLYFVLLA